MLATDVQKHQLYVDNEKLVSNVVYRICNSTRNYNDAEDIVQGVWLQIFRKLPQFRDDGTPFSHWAGVVARNFTLTALRAFWYRARREVDLEEWSAAIEPDVELALDSILNAIPKLSPRKRAIFSMYYIDGFSHKEIAQQLGITLGNSRMTLYKARTHIRTLLAVPSFEVIAK